jgi:hypothetical protein
MEYLIGLGLATVVALFARFIGLDRDRAFYPTVMIVIACLYGLFAILGGAPEELAAEWILMGGFILLSVLGFRINLWFVVAALFAHGVFDYFHPHLIANPGVPAWYQGFCLTYDVTAAAGLAWLIRTGRIPAAFHRDALPSVERNSTGL